MKRYIMGLDIVHLFIINRFMHPFNALKKKGKSNEVREVWGIDTKCFSYIYILVCMLPIYWDCKCIQWGALVNSLPRREDIHSAGGLAAVTHRTCEFLVLGRFLFPSLLFQLAVSFGNIYPRYFLQTAESISSHRRPGANIFSPPYADVSRARSRPIIPNGKRQ